MTTPANLSEQILALPSGAGAVRSAGQTFEADPYTGTGRYAVPIELLPGPNGIVPSLTLSYSTHAGAGIAGVGWSLGLAQVERRTDRGIPSYDDNLDRFAIQGDELLPIGDSQYRYRTEGRFSRVVHVRTRGEDAWVVTERDASRVIYGRDPSHRVHDGAGKVAAWLPTRKIDALGNAVDYTWSRDPTTREVLLTEIRWAGCYRVRLSYEARPDPIVSARTGFAVTTRQRLAQIEVEVKRTSTGAFFVYRRYTLSYVLSSLTGRSLLKSVVVTGFHPGGTSRALPALTFDYVTPTLSNRRWWDVQGVANRSLADRNLTLLQSSSGLPDLLEATDLGYFLRQNRGNSALGPPSRIAAPAGIRLSDPGVFLSDMDGDGLAELVVEGGRRVYRAAVGGFTTPHTFAERPSVDLDDPSVRMGDFSGSGMPEALQQGPQGLTLFRSLGEGRWSAPLRLGRGPEVRFDDTQLHLADISGDGLSDLVYVERTRIWVFRALGMGQFEAPFVLEGSPDFGPGFDPKAVRLVDLTGSGQADLIYVRAGRVQVATNLAGKGLGPLTEVGSIAQSSQGHVEPTDWLGTGAKGLLFTDDFGSSPWRFLELFPQGNADLLSRIDNGIGGITTLIYGSSAAHWARDRAAGRPWKTSLPAPQRVVDRVRLEDQVTGRRMETAYRYHHGVYDGVEREFRGFAAVEWQDTEAPAGDLQPLPPALAKRWFHTGLELDLSAEFTGAPLPALQDQVPAAPGARRALRGQLLREELHVLDAVHNPHLAHRPLQVKEQAYRVFPVGRSPGTERWSFTALGVTGRTTLLERTAEPRILETNTTYDLHRGHGYGLPIEVREKGYGRTGTFSTAHEQQQTQTLERATKTTYVGLDIVDVDPLASVYVPTYLVGKPSVVERWGGPGGSEALLARTRLFYDGTAYQGNGFPGSGTTPGVSLGLLSASIDLCFTASQFSAAYPSGSGAAAARDARGAFLLDGSDYYIQTQRLAYTSAGMVLGSKDPNGNLTTFAYDASYGLFPTSSTDALSHPTSLTRGELPFQVAAAVDSNDNRVEFTYDPTGLPASGAVMGKFVSGAWQGDPPSHPTDVYQYDFSSLPIRVTTQTRQVRQGATSDVHRYFDGLGRTVQERHTAEPDPATPATPRFRVTGWQLYNHKGLVVRAYQPVFSGSSAYAVGSTSVPFLETLYDPLGRPIRVNHPDGTHETTSYHPWVQTARDRNDNAGLLTIADPRYGAHLSTFRAHLDTPTRTYVDALGRQIAVAEDNGAGTTSMFRVTTYELAAGAFTGTTYDLTLKQNLSPNYFVMIRGTVNNTAPTLANHGVRVTHDPFGTGDLNTLAPPNQLRLTRSASTQGDWRGTVVVWESLGDAGSSGFQLVDVKTVSFAQLTTGGQPQTVSATANTAWTDPSRVVLYGGPRGGGSSSTSTVSNMHHALHSALTPSGTNTLTGTRWRTAGTFPAADFTVYVVQWGSEHLIQRVTVTGTAGGDGADTAGEWNTAALGTTVRTASSWVWASGWSKAAGIGDSFNGLVLSLGDGLSVPDFASTVAVGSEATAVDKSVVVTVHSHPSLLVHWLRKPDGDGTATSLGHTVTLSGETETYDAVSNPRSTLGLRVPVHTHTVGSTSNDYAQGTWFARHTAADTMTANRVSAAPTAAWVAWVQSVETVGVVAPTVTSPELHVTRSVLDLKDQVLQVFDARNLGFATWTFAYDLAGRRTSTAHATGTGTRWSLSDAVGNPIWSRDARAIEVDRTFDALKRPLTEESDDGSMVKLRRKWTYVPYNAADSASKSKNLFGRVEEERDQDGLRYFEYDWRGLATKISHRFWAEDPTTTSGSADEAAIPSAARGSLPGTSWLPLTELLDTITAAVTTSHDAAGHPLVEVWPTPSTPGVGPMRRAFSYNAAGTLSELQYDNGAGAWQVAVTAMSRNARGQLTDYLHGNGVACTREYDAVTERLTRIFTRQSSPGTTRFQDLVYAYDPVGNPVQITDQLAMSSFASNQIIPNTRTFRYDPRYRLIRTTGKRHKNATDGIDAPEVSSPSLTDYVPYTHRYSYDAVGHFTTNQEYKSGTNNLKYKSGLPDLFDGYGAESYAYDANGCCTSTPRHQTLAYAFDEQPVFVDMGGGTKVRYRRHGDQRVVRFVTKSGGISARGIYLGPWEYHRREGSGAFTKTVLHLETKSRCAQVERVLAGSDPNSLPIFHIHADHLGSAQLLTGAGGTWLSQEEFFAYGRSSDRRERKNRYRYIGVERDEDTGLCLTGPRLYDPLIGRFHQPDPAGNVPYVYCHANPVTKFDSNGYQDEAFAPERGTAAAREQWNTIGEGLVNGGLGFIEGTTALGDIANGMLGLPTQADIGIPEMRAQAPQIGERVGQDLWRLEFNYASGPLAGPASSLRGALTEGVEALSTPAGQGVVFASQLALFTTGRAPVGPAARVLRGDQAVDAMRAAGRLVTDPAEIADIIGGSLGVHGSNTGTLPGIFAFIKAGGGAGMQGVTEGVSTNPIARAVVRGRLADLGGGLVAGIDLSRIDPNLVHRLSDPALQQQLLNRFSSYKGFDVTLRRLASEGVVIVEGAIPADAVNALRYFTAGEPF
jgi:RHS repeat-associated protein